MACIHTAAQTTFIDLSQAEAYCRYMGTKFKLSYSKDKYKFGNVQQTATGSIIIQVLFQYSSVITERIDVVNMGVPIIIGPDFLDKYSTECVEQFLQQIGM